MTFSSCDLQGHETQAAKRQEYLGPSKYFSHRHQRLYIGVKWKVRGVIEVESMKLL